MPKKETSKYFYILSIIGALLVIAIAIGSSYAFFTNSKSYSTATVITSGSLSLELIDGNVVGTTKDMIPGDTVTKSFSVRNTGIQAIAYDIYLSEILNDFADKSDLVYSLTSPDGGFISSNDLEVPSEAGLQSKIIDSYLINPGVTHTYTLTIKFLSKNKNQDNNKGKTFSAKIQINDYSNYTIAYLDTGRKVNVAMKQLADPDNDDVDSWDNDQNITTIARANQIDNTKNIVDVSVSPDHPINIWYDNGTIYFYTDASIISMNENSSEVFSRLNKLISVDLSMFDTSNVTDMNSMFLGDSSLTSIDLSRFNTSNVTNMISMFNSCTNLSEINIRNLNMSKVERMFSAFSRTGLTSVDLRGLDFSSAIDMGFLFDGSSKLESVNFGGLNMPKLESMRGMFNYCEELTTVNFDGVETPSLINTSMMFSSASKIKNLDLTGLDTAKLKDMNSMFQRTTSLETLDLSTFDTSSATDMGYMFSSDSNLTTVYVGSLWVTDNVTSTWSGKGLFTDCTSIVGGAGTRYDSNHVDIDYATIDRASNPGYFTYKRNKNFTEGVEGKVAILFNSDYYGTVPQVVHRNIGETLGELPSPTSIKAGVEFVGWYFDSEFANEATSDYLLSSNDYGYWKDYVKLYAKYKGANLNENGYNYWNNDYKYGSFASTSAPAIVYSNYTYIVESGTPSPLIRTTYENGSPTKHEACIYANDNLFCVNYHYWESIIGSDEESEENGLTVKNAFESDINNALGLTISCSSGEYSVRCQYEPFTIYIFSDGNTSVWTNGHSCTIGSRDSSCY